MRNNASRADNQQERLGKISASTEGSFNVALIPRKEYRFGWKIYLTFNVAQKDPTVLKLMHKYFGVGRLEQRKDEVWNYSVNDFNSLKNKIIPFFNRYPFLSDRRKKNFSIFKEIVEIIRRDEHFMKVGLEKIIHLREKLNEGKGRKRKYSLIDYQKSQESSETIRQMPISLSAKI